MFYSILFYSVLADGQHVLGPDAELVVGGEEVGAGAAAQCLITPQGPIVTHRFTLQLAVLV